MLKAIIFDVDGVLITGERFSERIEKEYGIPLEKVLPFFKGVFDKCQTGEDDLKEELGKVIKDWGWEKSVDELLAFWFSEDEINKELLETIQNYRNQGIKCYLGTNQEKYRAAYLMKLFENKLDGSFVSAKIGYRKPGKEFFKNTITKLNVNPNEILFWDSSEEVVTGAKKFGMNSELYTTIKDFKTKMTKYL